MCKLRFFVKFLMRFCRKSGRFRKFNRYTWIVTVIQLNLNSQINLH